MKRKYIGMSICMLMISATFAGTAGASIYGWPMLSHDPGRSGFIPNTPAPLTNEVMFEKIIDGSVLSGVSVDNGKVYVTTTNINSDSHIYCFNAYTGAPVFDYASNDLIKSVPAINTEDNRIYFGSNDNYLHCLDASTGNEIWSFNLGGDTSSSPALIDNKIYIAGYKSIYCVKDMGDHGELDWDYTPLPEKDLRTSLAISNGRAYIGSVFNTKVYCVEEGNLAWDQSISGKVFSAICAVDDMVYATSNANLLYGIRDLGSDSRIEWQVPLQSSPYPQTQPAPVSYDDKIYIGSNNVLLCLDDNTGATLRWFPVTDRIKSTAAIADEKVYFASGDTIYCVDAQTLAEQWSYDTNGHTVESALAIYNGVLYVGAEDRLYAFGEEVENRPPTKPAEPDGPTEGLFGETIVFNISGSFDPEGEDIFYSVDWGDGMNTGWIGPFPSDASNVISVSHRWSEKGQYEIVAKAKENTSDGLESETSFAHTIDIHGIFEIGNVRGGIGLSVDITNTLDVAKRVNWSLDLHGGLAWILRNKHHEGSILVKANTMGTAVTDPILALGKFKMELTVWCAGEPVDTKEVEGIVIFFYTIIL